MSEKDKQLNRDIVENLIEQWVIGKHGERDRAILHRRMIDGICYEPLAEEFNLSVDQIKRIVYKRQDEIFRHI